MLLRLFLHSGAEFPPDAYTAIVRGVNEETGIALVEVYALD
jgi:hypothetical protein